MNTLQGKRLAVIGAGNIGLILLERLTGAGVPASRLAVYDTDPARASAAAAQFGVSAAALHDPAICAADLLLICTPPKAVTGVIQAVGELRPGQAVISFAAAVPVAQMEALVPPGVAVIRIMPHPMSKIGQGINPAAYGRQVTPDLRAAAEAILALLGETVEVRDDQMNACVGLSGAILRTLLPVLEGMTQAGIEAGLAPEEARRIAALALRGTGSLVLASSGMSFDQLKTLTPMQTVDEAAVAALFLDTARAVKAKVDGAQHKLAEEVWKVAP